MLISAVDIILSLNFGQFLPTFSQNPLLQSVDTNCEQPLFLVFQAHIKFILTNIFDMITNVNLIKEYVFRQYLSQYLKDFTPPPPSPQKR